MTSVSAAVAIVRPSGNRNTLRAREVSAKRTDHLPGCHVPDLDRMRASQVTNSVPSDENTAALRIKTDFEDSLQGILRRALAVPEPDFAAWQSSAIAEPSGANKQVHPKHYSQAVEPEFRIAPAAKSQMKLRSTNPPAAQPNLAVNDCVFPSAVTPLISPFRCHCRGVAQHHPLLAGFRVPNRADPLPVEKPFPSAAYSKANCPAWNDGSIRAMPGGSGSLNTSRFTACGAAYRAWACPAVWAVAARDASDTRRLTPHWSPR